LQQLTILRNAELQRYAPDSFEFVHHVAEAAKLALADRMVWLGDPDFVDVPLATMLSSDYGKQRFSQIAAQASIALRPGQPDGRQPAMPDLALGERILAISDTRYGIGEPTFAALPPVREWADKEIFVGDTCHLSVIDQQGNMVSATPSGGWLSSSPVIPELGFSINTRLQMTWIDDGLASQLQPEKRPTTTLSPSMALKDGKPYMAFGTPGGDQQDQWTLIFFLRHALYGMNLQEAIEAPSWHLDHYPSSFWPRTTTLNRMTVEARMPEKTIEQLKQAGHEVKVGAAWSEGRLSACTRELGPHGQLILRAGANPRGVQGYAVGR
jgi:gamma-glutamyltranspeptidase/glutathione hydrolase